MTKEPVLLPKYIEEKLSLTLTDASVNDSLLHGCVFYRTSNDFIVSNYDIVNVKSLVEEDLWAIFTTFGNENIGKLCTVAVVTTEFLNTCTLNDIEDVFNYLNEQKNSELKKLCTIN